MIREAIIDDLKALLELEESVFDKNNYPLSKLSFKRFIQKKRVFVYEIDNCIAGYILYLTYPKSDKIYSLAVSDVFRGKGISKELIKYLIGFSYKNKKENILLEVRCDNSVAIKLYESIGFRVKERLEKYYCDNEDGYKMILKLEKA